jgi:hypothetical protein
LVVIENTIKHPSSKSSFNKNIHANIENPITPNRFHHNTHRQDATKTDGALRMTPNRLLRRHPEHMRKIITYNKGSEHSEPIWVTTVRDIQSYLCKPYHIEKRAQWNMPLVSSVLFAKEDRFCGNSQNNSYRLKTFLKTEFARSSMIKNRTRGP